MATSRTYQFNPALSDLIIAAYGRCQIRRTALTVDHLLDAAMAANLLQVEWSNEQVNLWTVELMSTPLIPGQSVYDVDPATVMIMATWISTENNPEKDRILSSVDRDSYAAYPDKTTPGSPTVYWFNATVPPTITLWPPPDAAEPRMLRYYRARQMQDASLPDELTAEAPYRFLEAYVAGLAFKLSVSWAPARTQELGGMASFTFKKAKERDIEDAPLHIVPALNVYTDSVY